jgi:hypothetical protein
MDDETPWCGTYVAHCLQTSGVKFPKDWFRALAYLRVELNLKNQHTVVLLLKLVLVVGMFVLLLVKIKQAVN